MTQTQEDLATVRADARKRIVDHARRPQPGKAPDWVNGIPGQIGRLLREKHWDPEGPVWGCSRVRLDRGPRYDENGSRRFLMYVEEFGLQDQFPPLTPEKREKAIAFWRSWQNPDTGAFFDPRDPGRTVNEKYLVGLLRDLGAEPLYPMAATEQMLKTDSDGKPDTSIFLERTKNDPDWATGGWGVGSHTGKMAKDLFERVNKGQTGLIPDLVEGVQNILAHQDPASGLWGPPDAKPGRRIGGTLKVLGRFHFGMGINVPYFEELADTLIQGQKDGLWFSYGCGCEPRNAVEMICYCLERDSRRREDLYAALESIVADYSECVLPDGTLLFTRNDPDSAGINTLTLHALGQVGGYLNWTDCKLTNELEKAPHMHRGVGCRYRFFVEDDGTVRMVDTETEPLEYVVPGV